MVWYVCMDACMHVCMFVCIHIYIYTVCTSFFLVHGRKSPIKKHFRIFCSILVGYTPPSSITIQQPTFKSLKWDLSRHPFPIVAPSPQNKCTQDSIYMILSIFLNIFFTTSYCNSEVSHPVPSPGNSLRARLSWGSDVGTGSLFGVTHGRTEQNTSMSLSIMFPDIFEIHLGFFDSEPRIGTSHGVSKIEERLRSTRWLMIFSREITNQSIGDDHTPRKSD